MSNEQKKPDAWLVEGRDLEGKLISHALYHKLEEARNTAANFIKHYPDVRYFPLVKMETRK